MRAFILAALALAGCATAPLQAPINLPSTVQAAPTPEMNLDGDVLALAFSGGGARAAAFSLGALEGLRAMRGADGRPLLSRVRLVTGVSGGSITAAYFGQHGEAGIDTFRAAYLDKDWVDKLHTNPLSPFNWGRAARGGINNHTLLADWLDREVFAGGTMSQLWPGQGPQVWLNATDLYNGTTFAFTPLYFSALCSELGSVRIADAVAASMAVPIAFQPILAKPYPERCAALPDWVATAANDHARPSLVRRTAQAFENYREPKRQAYLHLVDGGVLDNLGLTSIALTLETGAMPLGPLSPRDAVRVRRMTMLVMDAEQIRASQWQLTPQGPSGKDIVGALANIVIESPNRNAYDAFRVVLADWERNVRAYRCALPPEEVKRLRGDLVGWDCTDVHFTADIISFADFDEPLRAKLGAAPTAVTLPRDLIDALIAAGRDGVQRNAMAQALTR